MDKPEATVVVTQLSSSASMIDVKSTPPLTELIDNLSKLGTAPTLVATLRAVLHARAIDSSVSE